MAITKGDFIGIQYTGKTTDGVVFDTTSEAVAKEHGLYSAKTSFGPLTICVGQGHVVPGLDESFIGKEPAASYDVVLQPEQAFGKKDAKRIELISIGKFAKANIQPQVGLQVTVDNRRGIVRKAGGGRVLVDFNHPLSGMPVQYSVQIVEKVTDVAKQVQAVLDMQLPGLQSAVADGIVTIQYPVELPEVLISAFKSVITTLIPSVKDVVFAKTEKPAGLASGAVPALEKKE